MDKIDGYEEGSEPLVFHYEKGSFRKRETETVRDMATGKKNLKPGIFKILVSTKANRMMLLSMLMCVAVTVIVLVLRFRENTGSVCGFNLKESAFSFEENIYVSIEFTPSSSAKTETGEFVLVFTAYDCENFPSEEKSITFAYDFGGEKKQFARASFTDFNVKTVKCSVKPFGSSESEGSREILLSADVAVR